MVQEGSEVVPCDLDCPSGIEFIAMPSLPCRIREVTVDMNNIGKRGMTSAVEDDFVKSASVIYLILIALQFQPVITTDHVHDWLVDWLRLLVFAPGFPFKCDRSCDPVVGASRSNSSGSAQ